MTRRVAHVGRSLIRSRALVLVSLGARTDFDGEGAPSLNVTKREALGLLEGYGGGNSDARVSVAYNNAPDSAKETSRWVSSTQPIKTTICKENLNKGW